MTLLIWESQEKFTAEKDPENPHCHPKTQRWTTVPIFYLLNERNLITTANPAADMDHIDRASAAVISVWTWSFLCGLSCCHDYRHDVNSICDLRDTDWPQVLFLLFQGSPGLVVTPLLKWIFTILCFYSAYILKFWLIVFFNIYQESFKTTFCIHIH